jgi:hypothetical protein
MTVKVASYQTHEFRFYSEQVRMIRCHYAAQR